MTDLASTLPPKAGVVFDVDGTLADTETVWNEVERDTLAAYGGFPDAALLTRFRGISLRRTARLIRTWAREPKPTLPKLMDDLTTRFETAINTRPPDPQPGVRELLDQLVTRAVPIAAVSNSPRRTVELTLRTTGLYEFFQLIVCADDDANLGPKPAPDLYTFAAHGLGIDPRLSWGVEDTRTGVLALQAAHFLPVAVRPEALPDTGLIHITPTLEQLDVDWLFAMAAARQPSPS